MVLHYNEVSKCSPGVIRREWYTLKETFDCVPIWKAAIIMLELSLMLISNCVVVKRMVTGCSGKLKAPAVKQKSFELERTGVGFFQDGLSFFVLEEKIKQQI